MSSFASPYDTSEGWPIHQRPKHRNGAYDHPGKSRTRQRLASRIAWSSLDLVHPSLYALHYERTQLSSKATLKRMEQRRLDVEQFGQFWISAVHRWLPTPFKIAEDGSVKILSYINSLDPYRHRDMYLIIAKLFECFIPMFERVLGSLTIKGTPKERIPIDYDTLWPEFEADGSHWDTNPQAYDDAFEEYLLSRKINLSEPKPFNKANIDEKVDGESDLFRLAGRQVQVIVKLANIHLTPSNPKYKGGVWHIEGMQNEEIVASGIYYYDQDNITESQLHFQGAVDEDYVIYMYEQGDEWGVKILHNIVDGDRAVQPHNAINTKKNRCIAFPSIYQHRVSPFSLMRQNQGIERSFASSSSILWYLTPWWIRVRSCTSNQVGFNDRLMILNE